MLCNSHIFAWTKALLTFHHEGLGADVVLLAGWGTATRIHNRGRVFPAMAFNVFRRGKKLIINVYI